MKTTIGKNFAKYLYNNFIGNFIRFAIGMASTRLVSHFFTTRSIRNLWGVAARKIVVDKQTFRAMEWAISIVIGFVVFELVSKSMKKKLDEMMPKFKALRLLQRGTTKEMEIESISEK